MNEAPEGLDYGSQVNKFARTPVNNNWMEMGKLETGRDPSYAAMCKASEPLRMGNGGSCDPMYNNSRKNK